MIFVLPWLWWYYTWPAYDDIFSWPDCDDICPALPDCNYICPKLMWWYFSWPDCDDICELVDMTRSAGNWFINKSQMFLHWYIFLSSLLSAPGKTKIQTQPSAFPHSALGNTVVVGASSGRNDRNEPLIALKAPSDMEKKHGHADIVRGNFWELWKFLDCGRLITLILEYNLWIV